MDLKYGDRPRGNILGAFLALVDAQARLTRSSTSVLPPLSIFLAPSAFAHAKRYFAGFSGGQRKRGTHAYGLDLLVSVVTKLFI